MILNALFVWFMGLLNLVEPIVIPNIEVILDVFNTAVDTVCDGVSLLGLFIGDVGLYAISLYLGFVLALELFYLAYQVVWFIVKKIPMLNVDP